MSKAIGGILADLALPAGWTGQEGRRAILSASATRYRIGSCLDGGGRERWQRGVVCAQASRSHRPARARLSRFDHLLRNPTVRAHALQLPARIGDDRGPGRHGLKYLGRNNSSEKRNILEENQRHIAQAPVADDIRMRDPADEGDVPKPALGCLLLQIFSSAPEPTITKMYVRQADCGSPAHGIGNRLQTVCHADGADIGNNGFALKSQTRAKLGGSRGQATVERGQFHW